MTNPKNKAPDFRKELSIADVHILGAVAASTCLNSFHAQKPSVQKDSVATYSTTCGC